MQAVWIESWNSQARRARVVELSAYYLASSPPEGYEPAPRAKGKFRKRLPSGGWSYWEPRQARRPRRMTPEAKAASRSLGRQAGQVAKAIMAGKVNPQQAARLLATRIAAMVRESPGGGHALGRLRKRYAGELERVKVPQRGASLERIAQAIANKMVSRMPWPKRPTAKDALDDDPVGRVIEAAKESVAWLIETIFGLEDPDKPRKV